MMGPRREIEHPVVSQDDDGQKQAISAPGMGSHRETQRDDEPDPERSIRTPAEERQRDDDRRPRSEPQREEGHTAWSLRSDPVSRLGENASSGHGRGAVENTRYNQPSVTPTEPAVKTTSAVYVRSVMARL